VKSSAPFFSALFKSTAAASLLVVFAAPQPAPAQEPAAAAAPASEAEASRRTLARARALAAVGKLAAAAGELEALRAAARDEPLREVARVLLASIYVELPDYVRAAALLDEGFRERAGRERPADPQTNSYFALAGQTINSIRQHLDRYRSYGLNVADAELPPEAGGDLEQLRRLLEKLVEQAKVVNSERTAGNQATALLEDAATVRLRIARDAQDRAKWQGEVSDARQQLFASETRIASISSVPAAARKTAAAAPDAAPAQGTAPAQKAAAPAGAQPEPARQQAAPAASPAPASQPASSAAQPAAGAPGQAASLVAVGSLASLARQRVSPSYPQIARAARVAGSVTVYLVVDEKGEVESVHRVQGPAQLQQAAIEAARRWKFNPTVVNGSPVRVSGYISFNFAL